jgi:type I restriction enzyme S subunit
LIDLLKEKRQAVISHAVTTGLDHDVVMKNSGVEWLGEVPSGWSIRPVKELARPGRKTFTDGDWVESPFITDDGIRLIQTGNVGIGLYKEQGFRYISEKSFEELGCTEIFPEDVLVCRLDGPVGRACMVPDLGVRMVTSVDNTIVKVRPDVDARFVVYLMVSAPWLNWIDVLCRVGGGFRVRISRKMLGDLPVPCPPYLDQVNIADWLDQECSKVDGLIAQAESAIGLLQERRSALISAAVTGKIDVRNYTPKEAV